MAPQSTSKSKLTAMLIERNKSAKQRTAVVCKNTTHDMRFSSEYESWRGAKARCQRRTHRRYADYGGRGIRMCAAWADSFEQFYADMGSKPTPKHSIDRIDNDGDYAPGNCRWATHTEQAYNQRLRGCNKSGMAGVCRRSNGRWRAYISIGGSIVSLGTYEHIFDAYCARRSAENTLEV